MNKAEAKSAKRDKIIHRDTDFALKRRRVAPGSELTSSTRKLYARKATKNISFDTSNDTILPAFTRHALLRAANCKVIKSFRDLQSGWNGGSGEPVPDLVIERALRIVRNLPFQAMDLFPTGRKSIQLEFDNDSQSLEVEIGETAANILLANDADETYQEHEIATDEEVIAEITRFHERADR